MPVSTRTKIILKKIARNEELMYLQGDAENPETYLPFERNIKKLKSMLASGGSTLAMDMNIMEELHGA